MNITLATKEFLRGIFECIANVSGNTVMIMICIVLIGWVGLIFLKQSKPLMIFKLCFTIFTVILCVLMVFIFTDTKIDASIDRINFIATLLLTFIALKMSISQNRIANFEFCEKIVFPNIKQTYSLGVTKSTEEEKYIRFKQGFKKTKNMDENNDNNIYDFVFELDKSLNPQICYELSCVKIFDSRTSITQIKKHEKTKCDVYEQVSFESNALETSKMHIAIEDTNKRFLPVLANLGVFDNVSCTELSVLFDFKITDLANDAFKNRNLYLIVRFLRDNNKKYVISNVQTFVNK